MTQSTISLRTPADIVASVPTLVGFVPENSLITIVLSDRKIKVVARADLPEDERQTPGMLLDSLAPTAPGDQVIFVLWGELRNELDIVRQVAVGEFVLDFLQVHNGRWYSLLCENPECCDPAGTPIETTPEAARLATEHAGLGRGVLGSRAELKRSIEATEPWTQADLPATPRDPDVVLRELMARDPSEPIVAADAAAIMPGLANVRSRDKTLAVAVNDTFAASRAFAALARFTPAEHAADFYATASAVFMLDGSGGLANVALDKALAADPAHPLGRIMEMIITAGTSPQALIEIVNEFAALAVSEGHE